MDSNWIRHVRSDDEKSKVKETIRNSKYTLDVLSSILNKELEEVQSSSKEDYKIPNWSCYQADRNGYERAIKRFLNLININDVFNTPAEGTTAPTVTTSETYTGTVAELVGEGKKYKTLEALASAVIHKDEFIEVLKKEKQDVLEKLEKNVNTGDVFDKLINSTPQPQQTAAPLSSEDLTKLIEETVSKTETKKIENTNIEVVKNKMTDHFGTLEKAEEFVKTKARELGLSVPFLMSTAMKSPSAFYNVVGVTLNSGSGNNPITTGSINTEGNVNPNTTKVGTKAYFDAIFKADKKRYFTPTVQKQIQEAGFKGTYFA